MLCERKVTGGTGRDQKTRCESIKELKIIFVIKYQNRLINKAFNIHFCNLYYSPIFRVTYTRVCIDKLILVMMSRRLLETCTELNKYIEKNCASIWSFTINRLIL